MKKKLAKITFYVALLLTVFLAQRHLTTLNSHPVTPEHGAVDLTGFDLSRQLVHIVEREWEYYPGLLLAPADFANGIAPAPLFGDNASQADFGTYRLTLRLPLGRMYSLSGRSFPFSQRVFINGRLVGEVGSPGVSRDQTVPRTRYFEYHFQPGSGGTEVIFQAAGFVHRRSARNEPVKLAESGLMDRYRALEFIRTSVVVGCFITVFIYFLGMFVFFPGRLYFLFLALACLATGVRMLFIEEKHIMEVFPDLSWFIAIRVEYVCIVVFVIFWQLYFATLYPGLLPRWFVAAVVALSVLYLAVVLFADTVFFTSQLKWYVVVWTTALAATLWKMTLRVRLGDMRTILIYTGLIVFVAAAAYDEVTARVIYGIRLNNTLIAGVLVCVFMNMIALTVDFAEIEGELAEARVRQREMDETNGLLDRLNVMKSRFMANISHEMKTPLTVMSVHAQLSKALLASDADRAEVNESLDTISRESGRLARLVGGMLDVVGAQEARSVMEPVDFSLLLRKSGEAYRAILEKRRNMLAIAVPPNLPPVLGNADMLTQVVFNLFANANRHTEGGVVALAAKEADGKIVVTLRDNGSGIDEKLLPAVFEQGVGDGWGSGAGLGLSICRMILHKHGGEISIENADGGGTLVRFTLPVGPEEKA